MFEIRSPTNGMPGRPVRLGGQRLADELRQGVRALRSRRDRLVDRREVGRAVERQAEDGLARCPDDPPDAGRRGRVEHVPGREGVDPERLALRPDLRGRDRGEVDDRVRAPDDVVDLAEIGEVRQDALPVLASVVDDVDVQHHVAVITEVADHPAAGFAGASGDDDSHGRPA